MSWKKFVKPVNSVLPIQDRVASGMSHESVHKYSNWLPEVYAGPPDRLQRYTVYDQMNFDHEISASLDTITDFSTEPDDISKLPFIVQYNAEPTPTEINILERTLGQWCRLNELNKRMWSIFRATLQYGDQFFLRDPETYKLYWIDPAKVEKVIVNESEGKKIESYFIQDVDLNMQDLVATNQLNRLTSQQFGTNSIVFSPPLVGNLNYVSGGNYGQAGTMSYNNIQSLAVDAAHVRQISLTDGMNASWPFGLSILETIYKVYKQKELLEDSILIYRVHRAPERRVFFIDVGTMPPNKAQQYLERVKYEVQQKRIPSRTGGGCFSMDTKIPLLDGRELTISDLAEEYNQGKQNWAYSCNPEDGSPAPGLITWAGVTQKSAKVIKVTLDNGATIICTPEHKFPIIGKGFVEAKDIAVNEDSLISFNTRLFDINEKGNLNSPQYHQVYNHNNNSWEFTHRVIARYMKKLGLHQEHVYDVKHSIRSRLKNIQRPSRKLAWDQTMLKIVVDTVSKNNIEMMKDAHLQITGNNEFISKYMELNSGIKGNAKSSKFSMNTFRVFLLDHGYASWTDFKNKLSMFNHKIVSIEYLADEIEVGTLTIDGDEKYHNFHTFALSNGVYTKNSSITDSTYNPMSILEDYFFAITSEGRGSKVEVLPGGENLGSIDDLRYFNNKMLRALGVPSSYLPTGPEDGTTAYVDGRVGTAFIQEFRFAKVCRRYQQKIIKPLDEEFKLYLKHRGITIDNSLFELSFTEPQSFSEYRRLELDAAKINTFSALTEIPYISKRYILKRYLGWSQEEMAENERMWKEERGRLKAIEPAAAGGGAPGGMGGMPGMDMGGGMPPSSELSDVGITPSGIEGMSADEVGEEGEGEEGPEGQIEDFENS